MLVAEGWSVAAAADTEGAVRQIEAGGALPDLLLAAMHAGSDDAFALIQESQGRPEWRSLPVIVVAGEELSPGNVDRLRERVRMVLLTGRGFADRTGRGIATHRSGEATLLDGTDKPRSYGGKSPMTKVLLVEDHEELWDIRPAA